MDECEQFMSQMNETSNQVYSSEKFKSNDRYADRDDQNMDDELDDDQLSDQDSDQSGENSPCVVSARTGQYEEMQVDEVSQPSVIK